MSGCERDEVEWRHPPDWSVVVGERSKQIRRWCFNLISNLWDLPQQGFSFFPSLKNRVSVWTVSTGTTSAGSWTTQVNSHRCSRNIAERRGRPRRRACFWNSTDPGSAELCSPQHAPVVPEIMTPWWLHITLCLKYFQISAWAADRLSIRTVDFYWPHRRRCPVCRACNTEQHRRTRSAVRGVCMCNKDKSQLWMTQSALIFFFISYSHKKDKDLTNIKGIFLEAFLTVPLMIKSYILSWNDMNKMGLQPLTLPVWAEPFSLHLRQSMPSSNTAWDRSVRSSPSGRNGWIVHWQLSPTFFASACCDSFS